MGGAGAGEQNGVRLVGHKNFVRNNPMSDKFTVHKFHHIEFWTADATNTYKRFQIGLGMDLVAKSDHSTGNTLYASYALRSNDLVFSFTAPYSRKMAESTDNATFPNYKQQLAYDFIGAHGLAVRAVGIVVGDAAAAYEVSVANGARPVLAPTTIPDKPSNTCQVIAEVELYGDVVLRYVSGAYQGPYLAGYAPVSGPQRNYGIQRLDHAVGNVFNLIETLEYVMKFTGFHEFAEFVAADVGTTESGLNSMVLASNNEMVLLPINEPTYGTKRKSQIQTYLEQNEGPGLQHLALKTDDIISTLRAMRAVSHTGGFEFMPVQDMGYYDRLPARIGSDVLSPQMLADLKDLEVLVDRDDQGVLLQIFTKPLGDRPTVFIEIIQRLCLISHPSAVPAAAVEESAAAAAVELTGAAAVAAEVHESKAVGVLDSAGVDLMMEVGGCGGFGKGNFSELFRSIEDYEKTLKV